MKVLIKQAAPIKALRSSDSQRINLCIDRGVIVELSGQTPSQESFDLVLDAAGRHSVMPGLIDCSFHLPKYGFHSGSDHITELNVAAASGVSSVCCTLDDGLDLESQDIVCPASAKRKVREKTSKVLAVAPLNTNRDGRQVLNELARLLDEGCVAFTNGSYSFKDTRILKRTLQYAADFDCPLLLQPVDEVWLKHGCIHDGQMAAHLGLPGIPACAETAVLAQYLEVLREVDVAIHICRVSCARSVEMIAQAKRDNLRVTADVAISHLFFSELDTADFNTVMHTIPPLRSVADRDALLAGVADGTIDIISSDHQAHRSNAKLAPFPSSAAGVSTVELLLPMVLRLVNSGRLPAERALAAVTSEPASLFKLNSGSLKVKAVADLCLINEDEAWTVSAETLGSRGKNCPFLGFQCQGKVRWSLLDGEPLDNHG